MNTNQYYKSVSLNVKNCKHITGTHDVTWKWTYNNDCTYLNSHLLEAPREYVLDGLVPFLNRVPFWPLPLSMHLVAMPNPVFCCLLQCARHHCWVCSNSCCASWFVTLSARVKGQGDKMRRAQEISGWAVEWGAVRRGWGVRGGGRGGSVSSFLRLCLCPCLAFGSSSFIPFSLRHDFFSELCFPIRLGSVRFFLLDLAYLCAVSFASYRALLPA